LRRAWRSKTLPQQGQLLARIFCYLLFFDEMLIKTLTFALYSIAILDIAT
jgi:hypothetical protein